MVALPGSFPVIVALVTSILSPEKVTNPLELYQLHADLAFTDSWRDCPRPMVGWIGVMASAVVPNSEPGCEPITVADAMIANTMISRTPPRTLPVLLLKKFDEFKASPGKLNGRRVLSVTFCLIACLVFGDRD